MSETGAVLEADHDIRRMRDYLGTNADGRLTTGPDRRFIEQYDFNRRFEQGPASQFDYQPLARYGAIEHSLRALMTAPETDDFGPVRPSQDAFTVAGKLLFSIASMGYVIPPPEDVDTDHDGSVRLCWRTGERFLELVVPYDPSEGPYLYYSQNDVYNIESDVSPETLKHWLTWMR